MSGHRADICNPYLPLMKVDPSLLDHDIAVDDSHLFQDSDGEEVCYVFCEFCSNKAVLGSVNNIVEESVDIHHNCQVSSTISTAVQPFLMNDIRWTILAALSKSVSLQVPATLPSSIGSET